MTEEREHHHVNGLACPATGCRWLGLHGGRKDSLPPLAPGGVVRPSGEPTSAALRRVTAERDAARTENDRLGLSLIKSGQANDALLSSTAQLGAELESARTELALIRRQRDTLRADLVRMYGRIGAARRELAHAARPDIEEKSMTTVYISIGNSDDKLSQAEWHAFHDDVRCELISAGAKFHGQWASPSTDPWQNACWCAEIGGGVVQELKANLAGLAAKHRQDSIAWAEAPVTEFLGGAE